jgi:hypothetical protein
MAQVTRSVELNATSQAVWAVIEDSKTSQNGIRRFKVRNAKTKVESSTGVWNSAEVLKSSSVRGVRVTVLHMVTKFSPPRHRLRWCQTLMSKYQAILFEMEPPISLPDSSPQAVARRREFRNHMKYRHPHPTNARGFQHLRRVPNAGARFHLRLRVSNLEPPDAILGGLGILR